MTYTLTSTAGSARRKLNGFSLLELMLVLAVVTVLIWLAVPRYGSQQAHGRSTAMQLELFACVQTLHALSLSAASGEDNPWLTLADSSGDGLGDAAVGPLAQARCDISPSTRDSYEIHVLGSDEEFELQAHPQATPHAGVYVLDHLGRRQWRDETS